MKGKDQTSATIPTKNTNIASNNYDAFKLSDAKQCQVVNGNVEKRMRAGGGKKGIGRRGGEGKMAHASKLACRPTVVINEGTRALGFGQSLKEET